MQSDAWREFWDYLDLRCLAFGDIGLVPEDPDALVWHRCQQEQVFLITNNRNKRGANSLEATIQTYNTPQSLPVFTIGDPDSMLAGHDYTDRVIDRLLRYLLELDNIRGTGRLYLP